MNLGEFISALDRLPLSSKVILRGECFKNYFSSDDLKHSHEILNPSIYCYPKKKVYCDPYPDDVPNFFHSYRGYYKDIALSISLYDKGYTVEDLLTEAIRSIGYIFGGYKGGFYEMTKDTRMWVSIYGDNSQFRCKEVVQEGEIVYLDIVQSDEKK